MLSLELLFLWLSSLELSHRELQSTLGRHMQRQDPCNQALARDVRRPKCR